MRAVTCGHVWSRARNLCETRAVRCWPTRGHVRSIRDTCETRAVTCGVYVTRARGVRSCAVTCGDAPTWEWMNYGNVPCFDTSECLVLAMFSNGNPKKLEDISAILKAALPVPGLGLPLS